MKIGIYGGAFNPPHLSHIKIVKELLNKKYLDKIIIVPVGNYYQKDELINFKDRYNMLKLIFKDKNIIISDFENQNKIIYTYQTLDYFQNKYKDDQIYFITGADNIKQITSWKKYEYILDNYKILGIPRNKKTPKKDNIIYANITVKPISSTEIRKTEKDKLSKYLDKKIINYIQKKHLYNK
ncbi:MAG: nicotinate (nicotinamide) nucleotide adenylyltransferase [Bacilli bacterium]|nr:nicotinate (nicotinamide) nucleotide adenylyltransferase [Bacilli bacterium]MCI9585582.1 nicotinate (nicotinamide) nucleotide adenylyltransferase [Bacilli bacterium]